VYQKVEQQGAGLIDAAQLMQPLRWMTAVQSKPATPKRRGEHTMQHVSTLPAVFLVLGWLAGLPLYTDEGGAH